MAAVLHQYMAMVLGSNQRHHEGPVLFALTQLAYSRRFLVFGSLNQLLHSIPQAPFPVGAWFPCRFTLSTICSAGWIGYQLDDYGPSRPDSNRNGRGVEPLPHHRAAPCCARQAVLPLSRWRCRSTSQTSNPEVSALGLIPGRPKHAMVPVSRGGMRPQAPPASISTFAARTFQLSPRLAVQGPTALSCRHCRRTGLMFLHRA